MITKLIEYSARNRFLVFIFTFFAVVWGIWALRNTPLDAIPDLSDVQVIIYTEWPERSPTLVEDQVTYPIVTSLLAAPKVKGRPGFLLFRCFLRLCNLRRRNRHLLGQNPGFGIHAGGFGKSSRRGFRLPWARMPPGWGGVFPTPWWTTPGNTTFRNCVRFRIGPSATGSSPSPGWPRSLRSADS